MLHKLYYNLKNIPGWRTDRKIVVFEADDWGSLRAPCKDSYVILSREGIDLSWEFNKYDTLATADDLSLLFDTLCSVKDKNGKSAVITAVSVVANPDFKKIKESGFRKYFYEPFTETLKRTPGCENSFSLWQKGIKEGIFIPQFHGREHLNVLSWLRALQQGEKQTLLAFEHGIWGFINKPVNGVNTHYLAAFDLIEKKDLEYQETIITDGLQLFNDLLGYKATYFVPPNGPFNNSLLKSAAENGIRYISFSKIQHEPQGSGKFKRRFHYLGQKTKYNQAVITRNCSFDMYINNRDWVSSCLNEIDLAFKWKKPAVIGSHRINFVGSLDSSFRDKNLLKLKELLKQIIKTWPDVEFMSSDLLGDIVTGKTA